MLKQDRQPAKNLVKAIRFSSPECSKIARKAAKFTGGDFSKFVRYAALHFDPTRDDIETSEVGL